MRRRWMLGLGAAIALCGSTGLFAQSPSGTITGRVVSATTDRPLAGVIIELRDPLRETRTNVDGRFTLRDVPVGIRELHVRAIGFEPALVGNVVVGSGKPVAVAVRLTPQAIELEGLEVAPSFFDRRSDLAANVRSIGREETRRAPGIQEDVIRAVSLLPGVGITTGGRNDLIVRGGAPYENLFVIDGFEVPNINHFGSQGSTGGPLSLINVDFVQRTDFSPGGFGVRYGDRTASITNIELREGVGERYSGEVNLSATGVGAIAEGPIGRRSTFWIGARRSYLDLLFRAAGFSFVPAYWDLQFKTTTRIGRRDRLTVLGIGAINTVDFINDDADDRFDNSRILAPEQRQYVAGVSWRRWLSRGTLTVSLARTFTRFETAQRDSLDPPTVVFENRSTEGEQALRVDVVHVVSPAVRLTAGHVTRLATRLAYDVRLGGAFRLDEAGVPQPLAVDTSFVAWRMAAYGEVDWRVGPALSVSAGGRISYYDFLDRAVRFAPRGTVRWNVSSATTLELSAGRYHQPPSYIWLVGDSDNGERLEPIVADHVGLGAERLVRPDVLVQLEVFAKRYGRYPTRLFRPQAVLAPTGFEDVTADIPFGLEPLSSEGRGRVIGAEVLVQKRPSADSWYGWLSASVARARFTALDGVERTGPFDARFIGNVLLGYRLGRDWELSGRFRLATGLPTTPFVTTGPLAGQLDFARYNGGPRLPTFHALDLRLDKRWSFRAVQLETYVDVQNVYARSNRSRFEWNPREQIVEADESLGLLPSIGVNIEF